MKFNIRWQYLLALIVGLTFLYSVALSLKRYNNYEYGKFDLGNMSQMVWNSAHGRFMEVTDQFGTNMPRWGMSHVDPVLLIFVPIYWFADHPMIMVFVQQFVVLSAAFALYYLIKLKTESSFLAFLVGVTYAFYPAIGYTLIWTTYHGVSFVAPILIWLIYFLEKNKFLKDEKQKYKFVIYWLGLAFLLLGKEQIGVMMALAAVFLYRKNKKLAIQTAIVSVLWFVFAFFVLIPAYAPQREGSVNNFINEIGITDASPEAVQGENFFLVRYSYLGNSYSEIIKNAILNPKLVFKYFDDNIKVLNDLIGPLGYVIVMNPFWLITFPDLAISMLSSEQIFGIDNHRIAFIVSGLFISYAYFILWLNKKYKVKPAIIFGAICLILTVIFSYKTNNPLFISATSFIDEKIIKKVLAQENNELVFKGKVPRNNNQCLDYIVDLVYKKNPQIYTGPDYLGAHTSNRYVNALFPARISNADIIVADLFDQKALDRVGVDAWFTNKLAYEKILTSDYKHIASCGMINVFEKDKENQRWNSYMSNGQEIIGISGYELSTARITAIVYALDIPKRAVKENESIFKIALTKSKGGLSDSVSYWKFEGVNNNSEYSFIDYITAGNKSAIENTNSAENGNVQYFIEEIGIIFPEYLSTGEYKVFYGIGDLSKANEVYLGTIEVNE